MRTRLALSMALFFLVPDLASAHDMFGEDRDFINGLVHPFISFPHLLIALGLGLLVGRQGETTEPFLIGVFMVALVVGLVCATFSVGFAAESALLSGAVLLGLTLVIGRPVPIYVLTAAIVALCVLMGLDFAAETAQSKAGLNLGTGVSLYLIFLASMVSAGKLNKKDLGRIGLRIIGSWVATSSLLALSLRIFTEKS